MPPVTPRVGPAGVALSVWALWRRLPPSARREVLRQMRKQVRRHGPTVAKHAVSYAAKRKPAGKS